MITYRRFSERDPDADLRGIVPEERSIFVTSDYKERLVTSLAEFREVFPDVGGREFQQVVGLFSQFSNLYLTVRPYGG